MLSVFLRGDKAYSTRARNLELALDEVRVEVLAVRRDNQIVLSAQNAVAASVEGREVAGVEPILV